MDKLLLCVLFVFLCVYFEGVKAGCGVPKKPKKCNPDDKSPCPHCSFCKKNKNGDHVCFPGRKRLQPSVSERIRDFGRSFNRPEMFLNYGEDQEERLQLTDGIVSKRSVKTLNDLKAIIRNFESLTLKMVDVNPNKNKFDPTIGFGFSLKRDDAQKTFKDVLGINAVDFEKIKKGLKTITLDQAKKLFENDIDNIYIPRTKSKIGAKLYDSLAYNVKFALVNAFYRGDIGPKTIALIKQKKWAEACVEYLNHNGYKNAAKNKMRGIIIRMNCNRNQICPPTPKPGPPKPNKCKQK